MLRKCLKGVALGSCMAILVGGCATWSNSTVENAPPQESAVVKQTSAAQIEITEADAKRKYSSLGDITVSVNKTTVFHANPTRDLVNQALKEKAAELGADAVVLVRYGEGGISMMSWGTLEGKGRAIKYVP